jgi:hypothetical protein
MYEDLNVQQSNDWPPLSDSISGLDNIRIFHIFWDPSLGSKQTKYTNVNAKNPNWPPWEFTHFARPIAMKYYVHSFLKMLEHEFLDTGIDGFYIGKKGMRGTTNSRQIF